MNKEKLTTRKATYIKPVTSLCFYFNRTQETLFASFDILMGVSPCREKTACGKLLITIVLLSLHNKNHFYLNNSYRVFL